MGPIARISVNAAGEIRLDGTRTTFDALRQQLALLRERNGVVWYHREAAANQPPEARAVMQLVIEQRLPISMSTRADFSDEVRPDGRVAPRRGPPTLS